MPETSQTAQDAVHDRWLLHRRGVPIPEADDAFNDLMRSHWSRLCRWCRDPEAEDIASDTFVAEYFQRGRTPASRFFFWATLTIFAHNIRRNYQRRRESRRSSSITVEENRKEFQVEPDSRDVRLLNESADFFELLGRTAPDMPPETMQHVYLRLGGWTSTEIADILGTNPGAEAQKWRRIKQEWPVVSAAETVTR